MALVSHCKRSANLRDKFYDFTTYYWTRNVRLFSDYYNHVQSVCFRIILVRIQSECGKIRIRITPNTDTFYAMHLSHSLKDPVDTGRKLNQHKKSRRRPGRLLNVLCTLNLRSVSMGECIDDRKTIQLFLERFIFPLSPCNQ